MSKKLDIREEHTGGEERKMSPEDERKLLQEDVDGIDESINTIRHSIEFINSLKPKFSKDLMETMRYSVKEASTFINLFDTAEKDGRDLGLYNKMRGNPKFSVQCRISSSIYFANKDPTRTQEVKRHLLKIRDGLDSLSYALDARIRDLGGKKIYTFFYPNKQ